MNLNHKILENNNFLVSDKDIGMEGDVAEHNDLADIHVGRNFDGVDAAKQFVKEFNEKHFTNFVVETNNKRSLVFYCKHSVHRDSRSKGKREHLQYNYSGCSARIRMYKSQKPGDGGKLKVTLVDVKHNHSTSKEIYDSQNINITKEEEELILTLKAANAKPSQIKKVLFEKSQKRVTIQKLKNLVKKISPPENEEQSREAFEKFLESTELNGGEIEWINDSEEKMKALFITSRKMKSAFRSANPTVIQLDTSFQFDKAHYKVGAFCYLDPNSDRTEVAGFAMMSEESAVCFDFVLHHFSRICVRQDLMFLIDKDFTEMSSIRKAFPSSIVLLCVFHCLKFMRTLFSTIPDVVEVKEAVMDQFKKVVYSHSEEIFEEENKRFEDLVENLQVRTKDYVNLKEYYQKNWKTCKLMWVKCFRKGLPLLGDNTTNRIENKFGKLKESIADTFMSLPNTSSAIIHLVNYADRLLEERYLFRTNKSLKIFSLNPKIRMLNEEASLALNDKGCKLFNSSLKALEEKRENLQLKDDGVEETYNDAKAVQYAATDKTCNCSAFKSFQAPCVHVLFRREIESSTDPFIKMFTTDIFNRRYHRKSNLIDVLNNEDDGITNVDEPEDVATVHPTPNNEPAVLSNKQKFKKIMPMMMSIANLISLHPTKKFHEYVSEFEKIENHIRKGESIFDDFNDVTELTDTTEEDYRDVEEEVDNRNVEDEIETVVDSRGVEDEVDYRDVVDEIENETLQVPGQQMLTKTGNIPNLDNLDSTLPQSSRFKSLFMKEKVKTRGRPKRKTKQLTFNKTAADRKSKKVAEKTVKSSKKSKKNENNDFIDDSCEEEDDDEDDLELDDDEEGDEDDLSNSEEDDSMDESSGEVTFNNNCYKVCFICHTRMTDPEQIIDCSWCNREAHVKCYMIAKCGDCAEQRAAEENAMF